MGLESSNFWNNWDFEVEWVFLVLHFLVADGFIRETDNFASLYWLCTNLLLFGYLLQHNVIIIKSESIWCVIYL